MSYSFVLNSNPQSRKRRLTVARPFKALSLLDRFVEAGDYILSLRSRRCIDRRHGEQVFGDMVDTYHCSNDGSLRSSFAIR